jgi:Papain family cysteine protease
MKFIKKHCANIPKIELSISILLLFLCPILKGQGLIIDSLALDSMPVLPLYDGLKGFQLETKSTLKQYCPTPLDQKSTMYCVAFACGYGAFTIEKQLPKDKMKKEAYSAAYLFNKQHLNMEGGIQIEKVLEFMKTSGVCTVQNFDNLLSNDKAPIPLKARLEATEKRNKIVGVFALENTDTLQQIKRLISKKHPVIVGVKTESRFSQNHLGKSVWIPQLPAKALHAMVVVGYNDLTKVFELMNSHGTTWGKGGFIDINYEHFKSVFDCAFMLVSDNTKSISNDLSDSTYTYIDSTQKESIGSIQVNRFVPKTQNDSAHYKTVEVQKDNDLPFLYHLKIASFWETPTIQLAVSNIPKGKNLYLFSLDAKDSVKINWPPNAQLAETDTISSNYYTPNFKKKNISPIIAEDSLTLLLPSPRMGMQVTHKGDDQIIMLIADEPIADFSHRIKQFKNTKGKAYERIQIVFGDVLIPLDDIDYMKYELSVKKRVYATKGSVIPVFLTINKQY